MPGPYHAPGVYIEEINTGPRPIEGASTAVAAFVGFAPAGAANTPVLVTSWEDYITKFGRKNGKETFDPYLQGAYLSHAVYGFFHNGGRQCFVVRVAPKVELPKIEAIKPVDIKSRANEDLTSFQLTVKAVPTSDFLIQVEAAETEPQPQQADDEGKTDKEKKEAQAERAKAHKEALDSEQFKLTFATYQDFGQNPGELYTEPYTTTRAQLATALQNSRLFTVNGVPERMPKKGEYSVPAEVGADPVSTATSTDFIGHVDARSGIEGLAIEDNITIIACPDAMAVYEAKVKKGLQSEAVTTLRGIQVGLAGYCSKARDRMAILDAPPGLNTQAVGTWRAGLGIDSEFATLYYPWIEIMAPDGKSQMAVPPCGHMAGIWARSDFSRGVWKAPANEIVQGALGVSYRVTQNEQALLNQYPVHVNCIRSFPNGGIRVWGARTLSSDPAWKYINVRRLFNFIERSIERSTQWAVFEPNDPDLWARITRDVTAFLTGVWRQGALFGLTASQAFFVICNETNNPPDTRDRGELYIDIGLAPVKPAEFVVFRFRQIVAGGQ